MLRESKRQPERSTTRIHVIKVPVVEMAGEDSATFMLSLLAGMVTPRVTGGHGYTTVYWRALLHNGLLAGMVTQRFTGGYG